MPRNVNRIFGAERTLLRNRKPPPTEAEMCEKERLEAEKIARRPECAVSYVKTHLRILSFYETPPINGYEDSGAGRGATLRA